MAPQWWFYSPLLVSNPQIETSLPSVGYSNCETAVTQAIEHNRAAWLPRVLVVQTQEACAPDNPDVLIRFRFEDDFPTTPNRSISVYSHCENSDPVALAFPPYSAALGLHCPRHTPARTKNFGPCPKTGVCGLGNPVLPGIGVKYQSELDYSGLGPFPLRFERVHNSTLVLSNAAGLGAGWWHTYFRRLYFSGPSTGVIAIVSAERPNGAGIAFNLVASTYVADGDEVERLEKLPSGGWKLTNREDETELYDDNGRLLSITNRNGLTKSLSYFGPVGPAANLLQTVTDPFGRALNFEYTLGRISAVVDPEGGRTTYALSTNGFQQLIGVTYPDGRSRIYHYENPATGGMNRQLTGITDELGVRFATYVYDTNYFGSPSATRALTSEHAGGAGRITFTYSGSTAAVTTHVATGVNSTRTFTFQNILGVVRNSGVTGPACPSCGPTAQTFDANGNTSSRTDWNGNRTNYSYDLARNLETSRTEALTAAGAATPQTRTITTEWHPTFRLLARTAEPLRITTHVYNGDGGVTCGMKSDGVTPVPGVLCSKTVQPTSDANGSLGFSAPAAGAPRTWSYTYNANGLVLTMNGPRTDAADITSYTYYPNDDAVIARRGHLATVTNAAGHVTTITAYNIHGQPLSMTDANGLVTTMAYDARQRLTSRTVGSEITGYEYDAAGQLTKVTLPDASFLSYTYDAAHRLTAMQDNLGNRIAYTLDLAGNRTKEEVFDPANALAQTRSRVYSNLNRLFQEVGAVGQTTEYVYDNQGNVVSVADPLNRITASQYDALNRLRQVTDPASGVTLYAYDGIDQLTQVTDPRNLVTGYAVNGLGNLTQQVSPDTGTTASTYDAAGNLLTQTDAKGQVTTYSYDVLNRVTLIVFQDGSRQSYAYDAGTNGVGRLTSITETNPGSQVTSLISYVYDQRGRVITETRTVNGIALALQYAYDSSGRLTGMTNPSGRTVTYALDALGRVSQIATAKDGQSQVVVQNVHYHPFGGAKSWTLGNGQIYSRTVDQDGRIASYTLGAANYTIGFDAASRITGIVQAGNPSNANVYGYDSLDRLSSAILPSSNFGYSYDAVGNRLTKTIGASTDLYNYSSTSNRIATLTPAAGPARSFVLDANGSTTADGLNSYAYDTRGRLVQATNAASAVTTYQVNALGQRVRKTNADADTVFIYDTSGKLISETSAAGTVRREYLYLGDIPVGVVQ